MRTLNHFLKEITPTTKEWKIKVVVAEKMMPRIGLSSPNNKYQRLILADTRVRKFGQEKYIYLNFF
jgi:hypothetical protein